MSLLKTLFDAQQTKVKEAPIEVVTEAKKPSKKPTEIVDTDFETLVPNIDGHEFAAERLKERDPVAYHRMKNWQ